jgi:hypothetical protein
VRKNELLICACAAMLAVPALVQAAPANPFQGFMRFTGTVERVDGREFLIRGPGGTTATYELPPSVRITTSRPGRMSELTAGRFVGCTAVKGHAGKLYATECHIFPESMRGVGEGHNPMGPPNTTMTNGDIVRDARGEVRTAQGTAEGRILHISYKGGAQNIEVSPQTHLTVIEQGSAALLKPGAKVMGASRRAADGSDVVQMLDVQP